MNGSLIIMSSDRIWDRLWCIYISLEKKVSADPGLGGGAGMSRST